MEGFFADNVSAIQTSRDVVFWRFLKVFFNFIYRQNGQRLPAPFGSH